MEHILELAGNDLQRLHDDVFPTIANGETVLFLGAGASVTDEKNFLSKEIMDLYKAKHGIDLDADDITAFVDQLSANPNFSRDDFDDFVITLLEKLRITETHKTIASLAWREIITTNVDLLIEQAFASLMGTPEETFKIKPIKRAGDYFYLQANDEVKYVKLNGCISDKQYALVFSSSDFERVNAFYRQVLKPLENLSPRINFLSVGYSYSDSFARQLLERFNKHNLRSRRWLLSVDPFVQNAQLPFFSEKRICVIKATAKEFFAEYKRWEEATNAQTAQRKRIRFTTRKNVQLSISSKLKLRIGNDLVQLSEESPTSSISAANFYRGQEPTFAVIRQRFDVIKSGILNAATARITAITSGSTPLVPILVLTGSYGIGKTTFCYRVINELIHVDDFDAIAFEVLDASKLNTADLRELFTLSGAKNVILFFNGIEVDSSFKSLIDFRYRLTVEQVHEFNIVILASIRQNILNKYKSTKHYENLDELTIDVPFSEAEATDLIEKLHGAGLLHYRDARERNHLVTKVLTEYRGDQLVTLIGLISDGTHDKILIDAYNQLTPRAQDAFLYTSLLYRFNLLTPANLLMSVTSKNWDDFIRDVVKYDSEGILIQDIDNRTGTHPDLYFRTKHPIISENLVRLHLPTEDTRFEKYKELLRHLIAGQHNSTLVIDLLRAVRNDNDMSQEKVNKLYDICSQEFYEDPHFTLHYAINLQSRKDEASLKKGIERIQHTESFLDHRNHRLIHRRAVLNFRLAQVTILRELELKETYHYINQARDLFQVKRILDPCSSFSYVESIRFEMWYLENVALDDKDALRQRINIEELLDQGEESVYEDRYLIAQLRAAYIEGTDRYLGKETYSAYLDKMYADNDLRPYALILKYFLYDVGDAGDKDGVCESLSKEMEQYQHLDAVAKVLFRHYGQRLYIANNRVKLFNIVRTNAKIQRLDPVRYHYYLYMAEAYNRNFQNVFEYVSTLRRDFSVLNPVIHTVWKDAERGEPKTFEGFIALSGNRRSIRITELQRSFDLVTKDYSGIDLSPNSRHEVILHFYLSGIRAEMFA